MFSKVVLVFALLFCVSTYSCQSQVKVAPSKDERALGKSGVFKLVSFRGKHYFVATFDPHKYKIEVFNKLDAGDGVYDFTSLYQSKKAGLLFACNGGMYDEKRHAIGLMVAQGKLQHKINAVSKGTGNFTMQPNGVFYLGKGNDAHILTTQEFVTKKPDAYYATQSGPMLVAGRNFNKNFTKNSVNLNIRNGVGVNQKNEVVFVVSDDMVNFYEFAELYRDYLGCDNALYFDGAISQYFAPELTTQPKAGVPLGPIVTVSKL